MYEHDMAYTSCIYTRRRQKICISRRGGGGKGVTKHAKRRRTRYTQEVHQKTKGTTLPSSSSLIAKSFALGSWVRTIVLV